MSSISKRAFLAAAITAVSLIGLVGQSIAADDPPARRPFERIRVSRQFDQAPEVGVPDRARQARPQSQSATRELPSLLRRIRRAHWPLFLGQRTGPFKANLSRQKSLVQRRRPAGPGRVSHSLRGFIKASQQGERLPAHRLGQFSMELLSENRLKLDLLARSGQAPAASRALEAIGSQILIESGNRISAWVPYARLGELERVGQLQAARFSSRGMDASGVRRLHENRSVRSKAGQVTSEAVNWSGALEWQGFDSQAYGIERDAPVRVAILDLGFLDYASLLGEDLPASVTTRDFAPSWDIEGCLDGNPLDPCVATGTALAEIIYDMDPAVELTLIAVDSDSVESMRSAVDYLLGEGTPRADVVLGGLVWSPGFYGDGFGEGMFNGMIREVIAANMMWVNDTGDLDYLLFLLYANDVVGGIPAISGHWTGPFEDNVDQFFHGTFDNDGYMDRWFATQDAEAEGVWLSEFCLGPGDLLFLDLVWSNWLDENNNGIPETQDDYSIDIFTRTDENQLILFDSSASLGTNFQGGEEGDYPWDSFLVENGGGTTECYELAIFADYADGNDDFHLYWAGESDVTPGTVSDHFQEPAFSPDGDRMIPTDTAGVVAVGSMQTTGAVESFSLYGLVGEGRPTLCAPADVTTRVFGEGGFATSFSAAHVAGAVSLLMTKLGFVTYGEALELLEARARSVSEDTDQIKCGNGGLCMLTGECR